MTNNGGISLFLMRMLLICGIAGLIIVGTAMGEVTRNGLVAEWHFDGDAKDSSGNGMDGTIYGATFADGKIGKTLRFNGINDYADFGKGGGKLDFGTGPFSIEFWMNYKGTTVHPNVSDIMGKGLKNADSPGFFLWITTWGGDGSNYGLGMVTSTASWGGSGGNDWGKYYPNNWYHVVIVRDGNTYTFYKNGDFSNSGTNAGNGLDVNNDVSFKIGDAIDAPNFNGLIDEFRIYNRVLSASEVKANYEAGQIIIKSSTSGAEVLINGESKGIASPTLTVYGISPGTYAVKCKLTGYSDYDANVVLSAFSSATINCQINLEPTPTPTPPPTPIPTPPPTPPPTSIPTPIPTPTSTQVLSMSPDPLSFNLGTMNSGESSSQSISISNAGSGTLTWNIIDDQPWMTLNPTSGTNSGTVEVKINTVGLSPGAHSGTITLNSNGGKRTGSVSLNIPAASTPTSTPPIVGQPVNLVSIIAVLLIITGLVFTAITTIKKDISLEVGVSERSLKYVGGAGILLIIIGAYILLKSHGLI